MKKRFKRFFNVLVDLLDTIRWMAKERRERRFYDDYE